MATFYAAYNGTAGGAGSKADPWNIARATGSAYSTPVAGDTVRIRKGYYAQTLDVQRSGSAGNPITYLGGWDGDPAGQPEFSGYSTAATGTDAPPAVTGWTLVPSPGHGLPAGCLYYPPGPNNNPPEGNSGAGAPYVYQRAYSGSYVQCVFCDDYAPAAGATLKNPGSAFWWWVNMWDMSQSYDNGAYGDNPQRRIHDANGGHSDNYSFQGRRDELMHNWKGQYIQSGATLYVRLYSASAPDPDDHTIYLGTGISGARIVNQHDVTLDGLNFVGWKEGIFLNGSVNVVIQNCAVKRSRTDLIQEGGNGKNLTVRNCTLHGAAMPFTHVFGGVHLKGTQGALIENCEIAYFSHEAIFSHYATNVTVRGCTVHDGSYFFFAAYSPNSGHLVERNTVYDCGWIDTVPIHKTPHGGIYLGETTNSIFRRNTFFRCGKGIDSRASGYDDCQFYNNTFWRTEYDGVHIDEGGDSGSVSHQNNVFQNNIFGHHLSGSDDPGRAISVRLWRLKSGNFGNNQFRNNCLWTPSPELAGNNQIRIAAYAEGFSDEMTVAEAQGHPEAWISTHFSGNKDANLDPTHLALASPDNANPASRDFTQTATSTLTINQGSTTGLLQRGSDIPAVGTIDIGADEYGDGGSSNVPPVAVITWETGQGGGVAPHTINLTGASSTDSDGTISSYAWNYGDGTTTTGQNPASHTYTSGGTYTISLTVTDNAGATNTATTSVTVTTPVNHAPTAVITVESGAGGGPAPHILNVTGASSSDPDAGDSIASYDWNWGDSTTHSTAADPPAHTYSAAGTYTVTLIVTDTHGLTGTATYSFTVTSGGGNHPPVAVITVLSGAGGGVAPHTIDVTAANSSDPDTGDSITAYDWNWGDGTTHGAVVHPTPAHEYANPGTYIITLTVTDENAATGTATYTLTVTPTGSEQLIRYNTALVTATSYEVGYGPGKVGDRSTVLGHLDGGTWDGGGYWTGNPFGGVTFPHAVKIDLTGAVGAYKRVTRVRFTPTKWQQSPNPRIYVYQIYVSKTDLGFSDTGWIPFGPQGSTSGSATAAPASEWTDTGTLAAVDARFVMVKLLSNNESAAPKINFGGIWEAEVYGSDPPSGQPGAKYVPVAATAQETAYYRFTPAKTYDGKTANSGDPFSRWLAVLLTNYNPASKWLQHDLGSSKPVGRVRIAFNYPSVLRYVYRLQGSTNGTDFVNLFSDQAATHSSASSEWTTESFTPVLCRYVRLVVESCNNGQVQTAQVWELESYAS